jgi:serine/threonine-protein kinase RsbW
MPSDPPVLTLILPSDLRLMGVVRSFVQAACQASEVPETIVHQIVLATNEAASNVVRHAHHESPEAALQVLCRITPELVEICVLDEGAPFDVNAVPDLDPAEIRVGGRGVFLMRKLMDELSCERRGEHGNLLRMVKRLGPSSAGCACG